jgi:toxin FitB
MPGYLLDTNALSILAPLAMPRNATISDGAAFRAWVREHDDELFLSTIILAEIQAGVSRLEHKGAARRAADLSHWLSAILDLYQSRTLLHASNAALETGRVLF